MQAPWERQLAGPHSVDEYVAQALAHNPRLQAQRNLVEAAQQRVPQAASLQDPTVGVMGYPFFPHVQQTAAGRMTADLVVSQMVPWFGKLDSQAQAAAAEADMARAELAAAEWDVIEQVKRAYYELYYLQRALAISQTSRTLADDIRRIAEARFRAGAVTQQDLLRAELEIANIDSELIRLRQEQVGSQARLARLLHASPDTPVRALDALPDHQVPEDLQALYERALAARPELHVQLAALRKEQLAVDLARLQYYPDATFSFGWGGMTTDRAIAPTSDGIDNLSIGALINLPVYRSRLDAGVREAEARTVAKARDYDALRDQTQQDVKDYFAQVQSQHELLSLFRSEIVPKAEQTLKVSLAAYEAGRVDFLQLIDNWQTLLRYQVAEVRIQAQLHQSLASLERVVAGLPVPLPPAPAGHQGAGPAPAVAPRPLP